MPHQELENQAKVSCPKKERISIRLCASISWLKLEGRDIEVRTICASGGKVYFVYTIVYQSTKVNHSLKNNKHDMSYTSL